jgi:hypothetical protein
VPDHLWLNRRECDCKVAFRKDGHLDSVEVGGACAPPSLQLGLALTAQADHGHHGHHHILDPFESPLKGSEDNYFASIPDSELEERATEERGRSSPAFPSRQQWETVDFPVRRSFD